MKTIVHIDLNCFFAQVEMLRDPSLKGKPIAIGENAKRGVLSTASYEARKYGVNSAMPVSVALRKCPDLILVPGHYSLYQEYSHRFFSALKSSYPILEKASIDECYIDMTKETEGTDLFSYLFDLQLRLYKTTQLKCSIGCGPNRFLAKMGSDYKKPLGLTLIDQSNLKDILWPLPIEKFFGIGKQTAPRLRELGIETIGDLAITQKPSVKELLGNLFSYYQNEANGFGSDEVDPSAWDPKSMSAERTFSFDATSYDELKSMVEVCCQDICQELHQYHKLACTVGIKLRTPDFVTKSKRMTLDHPTQDLSSLLFAAMNVFDLLYHDQPIRLLGVSVDKVIDKQESQTGETKSQQLISEWNSLLRQGGTLMKGSDLKHDNKTGS